MTTFSQTFSTTVLIIGGGATGTGLARDLVLRGMSVILAEKKDLNAGASGGNHGLLHSGARYLQSDRASAVECRKEGDILKKMAPQCVETTDGLFVAVAGDDEKYIADFPLLCEQSGIAVQSIDPADAREMEPTLSQDIIAAYQVPDATIDPFMLALDNMAQARELGTKLLRHHKVVAFGKKGQRITSAILENQLTLETVKVEADVVVNATGAWAQAVAQLAGANIPMRYSKGSLLVTQQRHSQQVINRLRKAADADIIVPGGTVSILGTTSERVDSPEQIYPEISEVDYIIDECAAMMPILDSCRYIRAYCGVRPLVSSADSSDDRSISRGFVLMDHADVGCENLFTITGGKLTTFRLMAEKTANRICAFLGITEECKTRDLPLPASASGQWTEPGKAPRTWLERKDPDDLLLCECEMVPQSALHTLINSIESPAKKPLLKALGLRSRIGKGPCQGTFCSQRIAAYLYNTQNMLGAEGLETMKAFLEERWRGQHPMLWDQALAQADLFETLHCNLFGLELIEDDTIGEAQ